MSEHRARADKSAKLGDALREHAVLVVGSDDPGGADRAADMLAPLVAHIDRVPTGEAAVSRITDAWYDAVIIDAGADHERAIAVCEAVFGASRGAGPSVLLYCDRASLDLATRAMRLGVRDLLGPELSRLEFCSRVRSAIEAGEAVRDSADREARLKRLCSRLDRARREVSGQVGELCTDLADAYQDLADQIGELATAGELNGVLRQELDIEGLLRTFLEYLLGRVGSTNAGVFLPNSVGDYSLGAYINYDRPKATAEHELEQHAALIAPALEGVTRPLRLSDDVAIADRFGEGASFFRGEQVVGIACHESAGDPESECLAVICLFRDRRTPFSAQAVRTVQVASELFGKQLARVIRVHHRHKPDELWDVDDDLDLAA